VKTKVQRQRARHKRIQQKLARSQRRIRDRLDRQNLGDLQKPVFFSGIINYDIADRIRAIHCGGIGVIHNLVQRLGLPKAIDDKLELLAFHFPYFESDHVLNIAYLMLCGGTCLEDLELLRQDENFLNALGARRIPDPTTAGDFCRRFTEADIATLQQVFDDTRLNVWAKQSRAFFAQARIDLDGHLVETTGVCKQGMDIAYDGTWGYHPLLLSLANTGEVLRIVNRSGNRPSHEGAAAQIDQVLALCFRGGFRQALLRGDTDFSQTEHLDRWDADPRVQFIFGYDARPNLEEKADDLPAEAWHKLERPPRYRVKTDTRQRPDKIKNAIVTAREFEKLTLEEEHVAEFSYRPHACRRAYRMVVVRKSIRVEKGQHLLLPKTRYFFYITNDQATPLAEIVFLANDRCQQENLIAQLSGGVRALRAPVDNLTSNWAYMVMAGLAWNLKAWLALLLPEQPGPHAAQRREEKQQLLTMEFKTFLNAIMRLPCQIVRTSRRLVYRLLSWNPWQPVLFRLLAVLHG
jgi:hypothetical protein